MAAAPFEAARRVEVLPSGHRARNLHGHSFLARVRADLPQSFSAFSGAEADDLRQRLEACVAPLDYACFNDHLEVS